MWDWGDYAMSVGKGTHDRISALEELLTQRIDHIEAGIADRQATYKQALDLRNTEIGRRLEALNGEAERLRVMQATYIPREVYEQNHAQIGKAIRVLEDASVYQRGRGQVISAAVATVVSVILGGLSIIGTYLVKGP